MMCVMKKVQILEENTWELISKKEFFPISTGELYALCNVDCLSLLKCLVSFALHTRAVNENSTTTQQMNVCISPVSAAPSGSVF